MQSLRLSEPGISVVQTDTAHLTINRKLGLKTMGINARSWSVHTKNECWLGERHSYVAFLWSEKIGRIANHIDETTHYVKQLSITDPSD